MAAESSIYFPDDRVRKWPDAAVGIGHSRPMYAAVMNTTLPADDICYRALSARDARFDGRLFVGVKTTGIYCRPICPAPHSRNALCREGVAATAFGDTFT